ncbi:MAG: acyl carrier protein [Streptosporangiaceae bacterium]
MTQPLGFDDFRAELAEVFAVPVADLHADTDFFHDLAFDSLRMLQLGLLFERLGQEMPAELAWDIRTVGNAYEHYARAAAGRPGG